MIGVDEHRWAPRRRGAAGFVTLIIDLTPTPIAAARRAWLTRCPVVQRPRWPRGWPLNPPTFARAVEVIAMDGFAGYKTAATEVIPDAVTVMDPLPRRGIGRGKAESDPPTHPGSRPWADAGTPATRSTGFGASPAPASSCSQPASTPA